MTSSLSPQFSQELKWLKIEKAMQRICKYMRINHTREIAYYSKIIERYLKNEIRMDMLPQTGQRIHSASCISQSFHSLISGKKI
jgi:hypothetical protein